MSRGHRGRDNSPRGEFVDRKGKEELGLSPEKHGHFQDSGGREFIHREAKEWSERGWERVCHRGPEYVTEVPGGKKQEVVSGRATERVRRFQVENIH